MHFSCDTTIIMSSEAAVAGRGHAPVTPPHQNKKYFLPMNQTMKAIQNEGVIDMDSPERKFRFKKL
jgi:hypothetical protein